MKRQTWLRHRIPTNTRAPLAAYTCLILGQTSPLSGIMWCGQNDSFNYGDSNHHKSLFLSGCLRPLAARLRHFSDLLLAAWRAAPIGSDCRQRPLGLMEGGGVQVPVRLRGFYGGYGASRLRRK